MYIHILTTKLATALLACLLAILCSWAVGCGRLWWRGLAFNFGPMVALAFFVLAPAADPAPNMLDVFSGFIFEFVVLCLLFRMLRNLLLALSRLEESQCRMSLRFSIVAQLLLTIPAFTTEGFGLFSEGTRLDYLYAGPLAKYLTYAGLLITLVQGAFVARLISLKGTPGRLGAWVIFNNFALSLLSGSKGGGFLWLASVLALVNYRQARVRPRVVVLTIALSSAALALTVNVMTDFIGITNEQFADLALSRFFLANDARALAFDLRSAMTADANVWAESFRSLATLFGHPPIYPPLGLKLYDELFGVTSNNGANASLLALITHYSQAGYVLPVMLLFLCVLLLVYLGFNWVRRAMHRPADQAIVSVVALFAISQMSQDFLAFQVEMQLLAVVLAVLWIRNRPPKKSKSIQHAPVRDPAAVDQRYRPGVSG